MTGATATSFPVFAAPAAARNDRIVVSLHDVAPATRDASEQILQRLSHRGVNVCSLLIVPDYHHRGRSMDDRQFVAWLRELEAAGHEMVIHGYFHERPAKPGETLSTRFLTQSYTSGEGEFYDLDYEEALRRITRAREEFSAAGLHPRGFIAPAWLLSADAERAAADTEMEYTTRLTNITDLRRREVFPARSLVYSVRSGWRRAASLAWNETLATMQSGKPLVRLSIHPPDIGHAQIWTQISRLAGKLTAARTPTTYRDWIGERRAEKE